MGTALEASNSNTKNMSKPVALALALGVYSTLISSYMLFGELNTTSLLTSVSAPAQAKDAKWPTETKTYTLGCLEFSSQEDQEVYKKTRVARVGTKLSGKTKDECPGIML